MNKKWYGSTRTSLMVHTVYVQCTVYKDSKLLAPSVYFLALSTNWDQGYRNRYDIIDRGHKRITFMYFFKDLWVIVY